MKTLPRCSTKCWKRKENKQARGKLRFASLIYAMRKIEQEVLNILRDDCYMTRKVIMKRTGRCKTSVYDAISSLLDADLIDETRVVTLDSNQVENAYMKIIE